MLLHQVLEDNYCVFNFKLCKRSLLDICSDSLECLCPQTFKSNRIPQQEKKKFPSNMHSSHTFPQRGSSSAGATPLQVHRVICPLTSAGQKRITGKKSWPTEMRKHDQMKVATLKSEGSGLRLMTLNKRKNKNPQAGGSVIVRKGGEASSLTFVKKSSCAVFVSDSDRLTHLELVHQQ